MGKQKLIIGITGFALAVVGTVAFILCQRKLGGETESRANLAQNFADRMDAVQELLCGGATPVTGPRVRDLSPEEYRQKVAEATERIRARNMEIQAKEQIEHPAATAQIGYADRDVDGL